jgi:hypothetical protein
VEGIPGLISTMSPSTGMTRGSIVIK